MSVYSFRPLVFVVVFQISNYDICRRYGRWHESFPFRFLTLVCDTI